MMLRFQALFFDVVNCNLENAFSTPSTKTRSRYLLDETLKKIYLSSYVAYLHSHGWGNIPSILRQ